MKIRGLTLLLAIPVAIGAYMLAPKEKAPVQRGNANPVEKADAAVTPGATDVTVPVTPSAPVRPIAQVEPPSTDYDGPVKGILLDGTVLPQAFEPTDIVWPGKARLDFNIGEERWPNAGIRLAWLQRDQYAVPFGLKYKVDAENPVRKGDKFEIWVRYIVPDTQRHKQKKVEFPYSLDVQFDPDSGEGGLTGYIDLVATDPPITFRGRFEARFNGEREQCGIVDRNMGSPATICHLFGERFRQQNPGVEFEVLKTLEMRRQKTVSKMMRLGYVEVMLRLEGKDTYRHALMVRTVDGWECVEIVEPWQIPEAFPVLEPEAPPNGGIRGYMLFITARFAQSTITEDQAVFNYKNELLFGGQPTSWCLSKISYRTSMDKKSQVERQLVARKTEFGWAVDAELLPGEVFDQATGEIRAK